MAYTPTTWVEGVTTLGPTNMNKIETELAYLDTRIPVAALSYGTTLPGSPVDGQEAVLVDSTTSPSYQWRFRYNASNSTSYKWEFVGGSPVIVGPTNLGGSSMTATTYTQVTSGPLFTLPRAGNWIVNLEISVQLGATTGVDVSITNYGGSGAGAGADVVQMTLLSQFGQSRAVLTERRLFTPAQDVFIVFKASSAQSCTLKAGTLSVLPQSVS